MVKHKKITLNKSDGVKALSEILDTQEGFTRIFFSGAVGTYQIGDASLDVDNNPGLFVSKLSTITNGYQENIEGKGISFEDKDDFVNHLYIQGTMEGNVAITILVI